MFILDTDLLSIWHTRSQPAYDRLRARMNQTPDEEIVTTIVTFQEQVQGWMSVLHRARTEAKILSAYRDLQVTLQAFCAMHVVAFDQVAQTQFANLLRQRLCIGTLDLRIASITLTAGATLLSRNLRDFRKVPGLRVEDWTQ